MLWTRLAPSPLSPDGGMPDVTVPVKWEVSKNDSFTQVVKIGEELAVLGDAHSVHAEVAGLDAGDALRSGSYSRVLTFTLSTTNP